MELGEWNGGRIIENLDNRGSDNRGSTVYTAEMATYRDQELVNGQKGVVNGSVTGSVTAVKQFPSLEDGFFR